MPSTHPTPWDLADPPKQSAHLDYDDEDVKAPYDDLIDQYSSPYGSQPHRTFAVDPSAFSSHGCQPSYTVSNQSHETKDFKSADPNPPDWEYPPPLAKEGKLSVEQKSVWAKVCPSSFPTSVLRRMIATRTTSTSRTQ